MKYFILLTLTFIFQNLYCQKSIFLDSIEVINFENIDTESTRIHFSSSIPEIKIISHHRKEETFNINYTLNKDYLQINNQKITIDKLVGLFQNDYTGAYDFFDFQILNLSSQIFLIFSTVDVFCMGTNQQIIYIILRYDINNSWNFCSSYLHETDKLAEGIKLKVKKRKLILKGEYIKPIKIRD